MFETISFPLIVIIIIGVVYGEIPTMSQTMNDLDESIKSVKPTLRQTANGPVEGLELESSMGKKYYSFKGIPFAAPPITGTDPYTKKPVDRRFKAPEPLEYCWTESLKAHNFSHVCSQHASGLDDSSNDSEDCLFLNIYVPAGGAALKPVLVWIHGGSYMYGSSKDSLYGPDMFICFDDVVVVTIQYRLGIFGFLNLGCFPYTGNMGLKDQQLALKWIHTNIENFSGCKDQILLFGQSAGGASVHHQMLNVESRKYFNRAFAMSSTSLSANALWKFCHLEQVRKCSQINETDKLIEYLKTADNSVLLDCYPIKTGRFRSFWLPTIEKSCVPGAFLTKTPEEIYNSNEAPAMDTMLNYNHYICWMDFENSTAVAKENLYFISDLNLGYSIVKTTILQTKANYNAACNKDDTKNTFLFRFDVHAALNAIAVLTNMTYVGATHADDLCYCWKCGSLPNSTYDGILQSKDFNYDIILRSVKMICNFARTGDPSIDCNTKFVPNKQPNQTFCGRVTNSMKSCAIDDINVRYNTWARVENIYDGLNCFGFERNDTCPLEDIVHKFICSR